MEGVFGGMGEGLRIAWGWGSVVCGWVRREGCRDRGWVGKVDSRERGWVGGGLNGRWVGGESWVALVRRWARGGGQREEVTELGDG